MDPGPVTPGLTLVEQILIAQVLPCITILRLRRGGKFTQRSRNLCIMNLASKGHIN